MVPRKTCTHDPTLSEPERPKPFVKIKGNNNKYNQEQKKETKAKDICVIHRIRKTVNTKPYRGQLPSTSEYSGLVIAATFF